MVAEGRNCCRCRYRCSVAIRAATIDEFIALIIDGRVFYICFVEKDGCLCYHKSWSSLPSSVLVGLSFFFLFVMVTVVVVVVCCYCSVIEWPKQWWPSLYSCPPPPGFSANEVCAYVQKCLHCNDWSTVLQIKATLLISLYATEEKKKDWRNKKFPPSFFLWIFSNNIHLGLFSHLFPSFTSSFLLLFSRHLYTDYRVLMVVG